VTQAISLFETVRPAHLAILGSPGVGKTSVALQIVHDKKIKHIFQKSRCFVRCNAAITPYLLVAGILQALSVDYGVGDDSLAVLHQTLEGSAPMMLVLDNFETPWEESSTRFDIENILSRIAAVSHVALIVTMRGTTSPSVIEWNQLEEDAVLPALTSDAAKSAFLTVNPLSKALCPDTCLDLLLQELDHTPLAIKLTAQVGRGFSSQYLLNNWQKVKAEMLKTQTSRLGHEDLISVNISISAAVNSAVMKVNSEAVKLLAVICHLPDGLLRWEERIGSIVASFEDPTSSAVVLLRTGLAFIEMGALRVLEPVRHFIAKNHEAEPQHIMQLEQFYCELISKYCATSYGSDFRKACEVMEPEVGNITRLIKWAMQNHPNNSIVQAAYEMSEFLYKLHPSVELLEAVFPHLLHLKLRDKMPSFNKLMGYILQRQGRYEDAMQKLKQAHQNFVQIGDMLGADQCLQSLKDIRHSWDGYTDNTETLMEAQPHFMQRGNEANSSQYIQRHVLKGHSGAVISVAFSPDGKYIISGSWDQTIQVWDAITGHIIFEPLKGHQGEVTSVAFSPDSKYIASGSVDQMVQLWDAESGETISKPFEGHTDYITSVAFSPDSKKIVSGSFDQTVRVWDIMTGSTESGPFEGHMCEVTSIAFSPDGKQIASGSRDQTVLVWDVETGEVLAGPFEEHTGYITSVVFSPDGRQILSGSFDKTIWLWNAFTDEEVSKSFEGHTGEVTSVAFSPDGQQIVSGSWDKTVRIWDVKTGRVLLEPFKGHTSEVMSVAFSPNGSQVISGSLDQTVQIWDNITSSSAVSNIFLADMSQKSQLMNDPQPWLTAFPIQESINLKHKFIQSVPEEPPEPLTFSIDLVPLKDLIGQIPEDLHKPHLIIDLCPLHNLLPPIPEIPPQDESVAIGLHMIDNNLQMSSTRK
jgi:WD40 repeat protein